METTEEKIKPPKTVYPRGRVFTASLKPAWDDNRKADFLRDIDGIVKECYIVNHKAETPEEHTHILLIYKDPRSVKSVANLLCVAPNFVEVVHNQRKMLRYLTHMDNPEKEPIDAELVVSLHTPYKQAVSRREYSNAEIADAINEGRGQELLQNGVSPYAVNAIARGISNGIYKATTPRLQEMADSLDKMTLKLDRLDDIADKMDDLIRVTTDNNTYLTNSFNALRFELERLNIPFKQIGELCLTIDRILDRQANDLIHRRKEFSEAYADATEKDDDDDDENGEKLPF